MIQRQIKDLQTSFPVQVQRPEATGKPGRGASDSTIEYKIISSFREGQAFVRARPSSGLHEAHQDKSASCFTQSIDLRSSHPTRPHRNTQNDV